MAGLLFIVCIPTSEQELILKQSSQGKTVSSETINEDCIQQISDRNPESLRSLRKTDSATDSIYETDGTSISYLSKTPKGSTPIISSDITLDRNSENQTLSDSRNDRPCEVAIKIQDTGSKEEVTEVVTKNGSERVKEEGESVMPMEKMLEMVIKKFKIENAHWCSGEDGRYHHVFITVGSGECCEEILRHLSESGIGVRLNSVVSVLPCTLHYQGKQQSLVEECPSEEEIDENKQKSVKPSAWDRFVMSVRSRLTVEQVVEGVRGDASLTFNFLLLLVTAGIVAASGLAGNSIIVLVASMLISPLMGPIMAGTFGAVIEDRRLKKMGILNELFGLLVCLLVGFVFGLAAGLTSEYWGNGGWPTDEMIARGQLQSLWFGVLVALPSGAAVAIGILGGNIASLVGVAISASLLPPAVNAGLLWALAFLDILWQGHTRLVDYDSSGQNSYSPIYSDNPRVELLIMGTVSLGLTLINIICIFLAGIIVLKVKEVAPRTSRNQTQFWKHDIKIARDYNKTFHGEDAEEIQKRLAEEIARTKLHSPNLYNLGHRDPLFGPHEAFNPSARSALYYQRTWSPSTVDFNEKGRPTLYDLDRMYASLSTATGQGNVDLQPFQVRRRRYSGGAFWSGENRVNSAPTDPSGNALTTLPTITENKTQQLSDSDLSEVVHTSVSSREVSSSEMPYNGKKVFTVTAAKDPIVDDQ